MTTKQKTVTLGKFAGLNLVDDPRELRGGGRRAYEMTRLTNTDVTNQLKLRRREGYVKVREGDYRKIWGGAGVLLAARGSDLIQFTTALGDTVVRSDMHITATPQFCEVGNEAYYLDGKQVGKFNVGVHTDWAVEEPSGLPVLTPDTGGLYPGCHHVIMTYVHADGRESGCHQSAKVELPDGGGISMSNLPIPASPNIVEKNIYCTQANSLTFELAITLQPNQTTGIISSRPRGRKLITQFMSPPPIGTHVGFAGARMAVAYDNFLFFSYPFSYHLFPLANSYVAFASNINMVSQVKNGLYVGADQTYFLDMSGQDIDVSRVGAKAIYGSVFYVDGDEVEDAPEDEKLAGWVSQDGVMVGGRKGWTKNLTHGQIDVGKHSEGAAINRKGNGVSQIVTSLRGTGINSNMYVDDRIDAIIERPNGIVVPTVIVDGDIPVVENNIPLIDREND